MAGKAKKLKLSTSGPGLAGMVGSLNLSSSHGASYRILIACGKIKQNVFELAIRLECDSSSSSDALAESLLTVAY